MYYLTYKYTVKEKTYYYQTDYTTSMIPKIGSEKVIKYNPEDPSVSYIKGLGINNIFQIVGMFFFFISLIMLCKKDITRNILLFIFTSILIIYSILGELYESFWGVLFIIVPIILNFACIMFFIKFVKDFLLFHHSQPIPRGIY